MNNDPRDHLALYYLRGVWWLITRETATKKHAEKMARRYKDMGYKVSVIRIPIEKMLHEKEETTKG